MPVPPVVREGAVLLLLSFALSFRPAPTSTEANFICGYTYYWSDRAHAWLVAPGAIVTVYKNGCQCHEGTSDGSGYYGLCLDSCRAPGARAVWLDVVASYGDMHDYYSFLCYGQDEWHDFYLYCQ